MPGSSVHGIFQARVLEGVAISYSRPNKLFRTRKKSWTLLNVGENEWEKQLSRPVDGVQIDPAFLKNSLAEPTEAENACDRSPKSHTCIYSGGVKRETLWKKEIASLSIHRGQTSKPRCIHTIV